MPDRVRELARAKLNLRLRVLGRDDDGFHALETIFLRLALADEVELAAGEDGIDLEVEAAPPGTAAPEGDDGAPAQGSLFPAAGGGPDPGEGGGDGAPVPTGAADPDGDDPGGVPRGPDNLCWRAARLFYDAVGDAPAVSIRLLKRIPAAGGLGGGSADAAAVLRGLARLHPDPPSDDELMALAGELGSDVPFALLDRPMALGWERGRRLLPLEPPRPRPMLLLVPEARVSTPEAFRWLDEARARERAEPSEATSEGHAAGGEGPLEGGTAGGETRAGALPPAGDLSSWSLLLSTGVNDFEEPVFARLPELGWWKEELLGEGAEAALLCGSGSTLCGIFEDARRRDAAADRLREGTEVRVVATEGPV